MSAERRGRTEHTPVLEEAGHADDLLVGLGGGLELDDGAIGADDLVRGQDQERRCDTDEDDHQEGLHTDTRAGRSGRGKSGRVRPRSGENGKGAEQSTHDVGRRRDRGEAPGLDVDGEGDDGADEGAKLEDGPEDGEGLALVLLKRVGHHDRTLGRPEEGSGDPEEGAGENDEPARALRLVADSDSRRLACWL